MTNANTEKCTDEERLVAIRKMLNLPTHNSIRKDDIVVAFRWFFDYVMEISMKEGDM